MKDEAATRIASDMKYLLDRVQLAKPNDRSSLDRRYAIFITDYEKLLAYFEKYLEDEELPA